MQQQQKRDQEQQRRRDEQGGQTKGHDQTARDMGRGRSRDHGRDQTAREMAEDVEDRGEQGRK
jgi:hypothetical protein